MFFGDNVGGGFSPGVRQDRNVIFALKSTPWEAVAGVMGLTVRIISASPKAIMSFTQRCCQRSDGGLVFGPTKIASLPGGVVQEPMLSSASPPNKNSGHEYHQNL